MLNFFPTLLLGVINCFINSVQSSSSLDVRFNIPNQILQNVPYNLLIQNLDYNTKFPQDNFVWSIELIDPNTDKLIGVCAITGLDYSGEDYRGFSVQKFIFGKNNISMQLKFSREAFKKLLVIRYGAGKDDIEKQMFFENRTTGIIYRRNIELYSPYKITLDAKPDLGVVNTDDKNLLEFQLIPEKYGLITCKATDGLPKSRTEFVNGNILRGFSITNINEEMISLKWKVLLEDHGKIIQCRAGQNVQNVTIYVYHYVTKVHSSPQASTKLARNSQLKCISEGGYPPPKTNWEFIKGPLEAYKHYQLRDNNVTLFINNSAAINSNWTFECRGLNDMPLVVRKYLPTTMPNYPIKTIYNFTIIDTNGPINSSQTGLVIVLIILFTLMIVMVVLGVKYRSKIRQFLVVHNSQIWNVINSSFNQCLTRSSSKRAFKPVKETDKPSTAPAPLYKYSEVKKNESQLNGTEDTAYSEIVAVVQKKHDPSFGPIHRV